MSLSVLLRCEDLAATRKFYEALGFEVSAPREDPLIVALEGAAILFTEHDPWKKKVGFSGTVYFALHDVDAYYAKVYGKTELAWPLQDMDYGSREFGLIDCNGYYIAFQQADP
jgi:catechol 2,3-dioxygenase-like lactoylglutathione lyase family enzyme